MSKITLAASAADFADKGLLTTKLDHELYDSSFQKQIFNLVEQAHVKEELFEFNVQSTYALDGLWMQNCYLRLDQRRIVFNSIRIRLDTKDQLQTLARIVTRSIEYAKEKQAHNVTLAVITDLALTSFLEFKGMELIGKDKPTPSSRTVMIFQSGVLLNIASFLVEAASRYGDPHHQYKIFSSASEGLDWAFAGLREELGMQPGK